jgi:SAM-dependent methyltransferase
VLDVGCGTGPTTRRAATLVGPGGLVVGADIARAMLDAARAEPGPPDGAPIEWLEADVGTWESGDRRFDAVISRFGVMFFDDPATAFANVRRATAAGGRLCVAVWAPRTESPVFEVPLDAALAELAGSDHPDVPAPDVGPFSLGDPATVVTLLGAAGWSDVAWHPHRVPLLLAGGAGPEGAAETAMVLGPTRIVTDGLDDARLAAVRRAVARALADHVDERGRVVLDGSIGIVTARAAVTPSL